MFRRKTKVRSGLEPEIERLQQRNDELERRRRDREARVERLRIISRLPRRS